MRDFEGKTAVITGAASGIGQALVRHCAEKKMQVALADIDRSGLARFEKILRDTGADVLAVPTDVSKKEDIRALKEIVCDRFGGVDLLFNNAGIGAGASLWESTQEDCQWIMDVNLWGVMHCIREFLPEMIRRKIPGYIINTSSIAGLSTYHPSALYQITKHAVVALSEQLYHDLTIRGVDIGVSVLCPGFVNTRIMDSERSRPKRYTNAPADLRPNPGAAQMEKAFQQMIKDGMSPKEVASIVFDAIEENRFYILTHPDLKPLIDLRLQDIQNESNPTLPPPPPMPE